MKTNKLISPKTFVVTNFNGKRFLRGCISSILDQTNRPDEVIVVDNGSVDGSLEMLCDVFPSVKTLALRGNPGLTAAYNLGLTEAKYDWVVLANNDIILEPHCLEYLEDVAFDGRTIVIPQFVSMKSPHLFQSHPVRLVPSLSHPWSSTRVRTSSARLAQSDIAPFGLVFLNRRFVSRIDDQFPYYFGEDDFSLECRRRGVRIVFVRDAIVYHYGSGTLGKLNWRKVRLFVDGWVRFRAKRVSPWLLLLSILFAITIQIFEHGYAIGHKDSLDTH